MRERMRIGELATRCGVSSRTIDYYTRLGLLRPSVRTDGNYRLYEPESVRRLTRIKQLQQLRLSLQEIREQLDEDESCHALGMLTQVQRELDTIRSRLASIEAVAAPAAAIHLETAAAALGSARSITEQLEALVGWNDGCDDAALNVRT